MLRDYRDWLESELKLLGNASHHAYSFGQANMAKRALERFDAEMARALYVQLDRVEARKLLTSIEIFAQTTTAEIPELARMRDAITAALKEYERPDAEPIVPGDAG